MSVFKNLGLVTCDLSLFETSQFNIPKEKMKHFKQADYFFTSEMPHFSLHYILLHFSSSFLFPKT